MESEIIIKTIGDILLFLSAKESLLPQADFMLAAMSSDAMRNHFSFILSGRSVSTGFALSGGYGREAQYLTARAFSNVNSGRSF